MLDIFVGALIALAILVPAGVYLFVKSGLYNVAAAHPHTDLTQWITHETMIHSARRHAEAIGPLPAPGPADVVAGFCIYETHCVACHGAAGIAREPWASGLEPAPPYLLDASRRWTPSQLFWIVKNGIKMTAMPSWRAELDDRQIRQVVGWIEAGSRLPPQTYADWRARGLCGGFKGPWPAPAPRATPRP